MRKLITLSALMLLVVSSVVMVGAKPSAERNVDVKVEYFSSPADKQFEKGIKKHFKMVPKKNNRSLSSIDESSNRFDLKMKIKKHKIKGQGIPTEYEATGKGSLFIDGNEYKYEFKDLIYVEETRSGSYFYNGSLEGTVKTEEGEVPAVFTVTTIPEEDKTLVTIGIDDALADDPAALAFGEVFDEYIDWQEKKFEE
ncbi:hypothetical protein KDJ56_00875 [Brevibacillus composti]|uniref:Uncharacterized protein n=1 Tax=Brevibacillus composti TaxID=2796470 RepID=A0A7T5JNW2_9BACL|nr:hypothetical protein [Brevibacillus composti]QQE74594.1 hypothetical protein JD108_00875 [Brevibacillus composti]QUO41677.1 hypothetical protein KDJ56_00875 [Brevibacillus composti]